MRRCSQPGAASRRRRSPWCLPAAVLLPALLVSGCGGVFDATTQYTAAASTISSVADNADPDAPVYALSGYLYIDRQNYRVAVRADATVPDEGRYQIYVGALMTLTTDFSRTTRSGNNGRFEFTDVQSDEGTCLLTVETSGGKQVQFTINLADSTITPVVGE